MPSGEALCRSVICFVNETTPLAIIWGLKLPLSPSPSFQTILIRAKVFQIKVWEVHGHLLASRFVWLFVANSTDLSAGGHSVFLHPKGEFCWTSSLSLLQLFLTSYFFPFPKDIMVPIQRFSTHKL
jgi:hypothetical protein